MGKYDGIVWRQRATERQRAVADATTYLNAAVSMLRAERDKAEPDPHIIASAWSSLAGALISLKPHIERDNIRFSFAYHDRGERELFDFFQSAKIGEFR